jgi:hypothetical protein
MEPITNILENSYQVRDNSVTSEIFDKEMVVLDLASGFYFSLNVTASELWPFIISRSPLTSFQNKVSGLEAFVSLLIKYNLIVACQASSEATPSINISNPSTEPYMDVFDDLSDLFMADPIHDVDIDKGWPYSKPN